MFEPLLRWALRRGLRDGVAGGSGPWLVVFAIAGVWQLARREPKAKVARFKLQPGERYVITCSDDRVTG
ncbi:MAG TPA: hypothetical protein VHD87_04880 [Acidimicrobiales bacterium]|nr:hypothetical protein [Acidimicrobiales bacterium]